MNSVNQPINNQSVNNKIFTKKSIASLVFFWVMVLIFQIFGQSLQSDLTPIKATVIFTILLATIILASFAVVKQADSIAHKIGEPFGTLILTLSIVIIEVVLIAAMLFAPTENPEIAKDSVFSVMMIIMNLVIGISLFFGGKKHFEQAYNAQGTLSYLSMIVILSGIGLILPSFIVGKGNGEFTSVQAIAIAIATLIVYGYFIKYQITTYSYLFKQPTDSKLHILYSDKDALVTTNKNNPEPVNKKEIITRTFVLILYILPIVLLSHNLGIFVDYGVYKMNLPVSFGGILIAFIVFTPESITAVKSALNNQLQRTINLCHGAFVSTIGLTIPAVLLIGLFTNKQILLGLTNTELILFVITILLSLLTFNGKRTTPILGLMHLILFFIYILLVFNP